MQSILSPDVETFSTPPSTPILSESNIRPSLSRRSSRPSNLHLAHNTGEWRPDIILESSNGQPSPDLSKANANGRITGVKNPTPHTATQSGFSSASVNGVNGLHSASPHPASSASMNGNLATVNIGVGVSLSSSSSESLAPTISATPAGTSPGAVNTQTHQPRTPRSQAMSSPCFVHSRLQDPTVNKWLEQNQPITQEARLGRVEKPAVGYPNGSLTPSSSVEGYGFWPDAEDSASSVTKQLAETAVGVREMSKQLGRTRVHSVIQSVLVVTKARDNRLIKLTRELALYLMLKPRKGGRGMIVYVDSQLKTSRRFDAAGIEEDHPDLFLPFPRRRSSSSSSLASDVASLSSATESMPEGQLRYWTADMCSHRPDLFDFVITLGGDGTVLFTSWLFQRIVPPVLPFALGSLGFLTNFDFSDHQAVMDNLLDTGIRVNLRMRFTCTVYRAVAPEESKTRRRAVKKGDTGEILMKNLDQAGWEALESGFAGASTKGECTKDKEIMCFTTRPVESFEVLNDLVVDRGPSPYVSLLELFGDEHHLTTVQADGLTISTPTGSTAYSLSAGGSLVHPEIPSILITPICPHTLSFRPMLLPDSMELRICVPFNSRSTAWASFDGRGRVELKQGDHIKVTASKYPFPTVCADSQSTDWFHSISRTLKWNERERQKSFVVVEEGPARSKRVKKHHQDSDPSALNGKVKEDEETAESLPDEEEDEVSDEEEKFDIDDLSASESPKSLSSAASAEAGIQTHPLPWEEAIGREKAAELASDSSVTLPPPPQVTIGPAPARRGQAAEIAARSLIGRPRTKSKSRRSRSRSRSGVETPDRFAGPHPHPPRLSPRHVQFESNSSSSTSLTGMAAHDRESTVRSWERGARDDIHSPRGHAGGRSRIPREREREQGADGEMRTPTSAATSISTEGTTNTRRRPDRSYHESSRSPHRRVAFAVWGHDESDSATSDSDA
ncbi:hypothetical protein EIP91_003100 [Steccherinum ochraceum]|uniref:NAD(+) kinase n=1 Tax=Steccherinum ochraceum TaxID=92696 RepID=A0A4R0RAY0_9APHY|nr:hypothetical protein EIP91_003100 [Steccherinum ochraceum]